MFQSVDFEERGGGEKGNYKSSGGEESEEGEWGKRRV